MDAMNTGQPPVTWLSTVGIGSIRVAICSRMASLQRGWGGGGGAADRLFEPDTALLAVGGKAAGGAVPGGRGLAAASADAAAVDAV
jgi:hypothetical protein